MERSILFLGPVGAGKTEAVRTLSDIEVVDTDAEATDDTTQLKRHTTVAMDMGVIGLDGRDRIRLYGAPGQDRFDFMWDILLDQSEGVILLIDHSREDPLSDLEHYLEQLQARMGERPCPLVLGVTHVDLCPQRSLRPYRRYLERRARWDGACRLPVLEADARDRQDMKMLLLTLVSMLEMRERFPRPA
ncbi:GTP-binding protein [Caldimonas tepidiphila]|uniref:GTP-binding protein n=1 Tax=Caldimonas tepidiphila TaxID=2315841 RepID=UPI000E5ADCF2|nr:ATP/GTP-binding protein [Caldimonas tepidiphila]